MARLRAYFFAGIVITAPIAITLYLAWLFITFVDAQVAGLVPQQYHIHLPLWIPGLGLIFVVSIMILIGFLTANFAGRFFVRMSELLLAKTPVIKNIYGAIKQILEAVMASQTDAFRQVVLVEYPRRGMWAIGFVTGTTMGEVQNITADEMINVFVPTTPNPTSGFLLFVPRKEAVALNMNVEDGVKLVISGGIVTPPDPRMMKDAEEQEDPKVEKKTIASRLAEIQGRKMSEPDIRRKASDNEAA